MDRPGPDFWINKGDTWFSGAPEFVACFIRRGPGQLLHRSMGYAGTAQWLVTLEPHVMSRGREIEFLVLQADAPDWTEGSDWGLWSTGAFPLSPGVSPSKRRFTDADCSADHKLAVTTRPDWPWGIPPRVRTGLPSTRPLWDEDGP